MSRRWSILVVGKGLLITPKLVPSDVAWMLIQQDDGPILQLHTTGSSLDARLFARQCMPTGLGSSVDVGSRVQWAV
jgi:hypothetical protein